MSIVEDPAEFGARAFFQQKSTVKWKVKIDDTFFAYLGAPHHVRSANASQAEVDVAMEQLREACTNVVSSIGRDKFVSAKLYYESIPNVSFVNHFPTDVEVYVKGFPVSKKLTTIPPAVEALVVTLVKYLPQYDLTLRNKRLEVAYLEAVASDWDKRDKAFDDPGKSNDSWIADSLKGSATGDISGLPTEMPEGAAGDGYLIMGGKAVHFSGVEMLKSQKHPDLAFLRVFGYNQCATQLSAIMVVVDGKVKSIDIRESESDRKWRRYMIELITFGVRYRTESKPLVEMTPNCPRQDLYENGRPVNEKAAKMGAYASLPFQGIFAVAAIPEAAVFLALMLPFAAGAAVVRKISKK